MPSVDCSLCQSVIEKDKKKVDHVSRIEVYHELKEVFHSMFPEADPQSGTLDSFLLCKGCLGPIEKLIKCKASAQLLEKDIRAKVKSAGERFGLAGTVKAKIPVQDVPVNSQASSSSSSSAGDQLKGTPSSTYGHKESKPLSSAGSTDSKSSDTLHPSQPKKHCDLKSTIPLPLITPKSEPTKVSPAPKKAPLKAEMVAGQRKAPTKRPNPSLKPVYQVIASMSSEVLKKVREVKSEVESDEPLKKKPRTLSFCSEQQKYLCSVCSKKDCGECAYCRYPSSTEMESCKEKPKEMCYTWKKLNKESSATSVTTPHVTTHMLTPHMTTPHMTTPHMTTPHVTTPHVTIPTPHVTGPHVTAPHVTTPHVTAPHETTPHVHSSKPLQVSAHVKRNNSDPSAAVNEPLPTQSRSYSSGELTSALPREKPTINILPSASQMQGMPTLSLQLGRRTLQTSSVEVQPPSHPTTVQPRSMLPPASHSNNVVQPASHSSKPVQPASHSSNVLPASHPTKAPPAPHPSKVQPALHPIKVEPALHPTNVPPVSHPSMMQPASHLSKVQPASHLSKVQPASLLSKVQPASHLSKVQSAPHPSTSHPTMMPPASHVVPSSGPHLAVEPQLSQQASSNSRPGSLVSHTTAVPVSSHSESRTRIPSPGPYQLSHQVSGISARQATDPASNTGKLPSMSGAAQVPAVMPNTSVSTHSRPSEQASSSGAIRRTSHSLDPSSQCEDNTDYDNEIEDILMKGLENGTVKLHVLKCGVSGPPETGKSHVRALMLNLDRPTQRISTPVATEADVATTDSKRFDAEDVTEDVVELKNTKKNKCLWKILKDNSMAKVIANTIFNEDYCKSSQSDRAPHFRRQSQRKNYKVLNDIKKCLKAMKGAKKRQRKGLNGIHLLYFVDMGGQPQFQEILPNFIKCDINLLVHNLSQSLEHCPGFNYVINGKQFSVPEKMKLSNIDIIEQSVRSIVSSDVCPDSKPNVAIVGTFKDHCPTVYDEFSTMLKEKSSAIYNRIKPYTGYGKEKCNLFTPGRHSEERVFAVDASEQGWYSNEDVLEKLRGSILTCVDKKSIEVPIKYFVFLQILKAHAKKEHVDYITLDECYEISSLCNIPLSEHDIEEALKLFNDCNIIKYFPNILHNIAFIQPGFLFGKVTDLIVSSFQCENDEMSEERAYFRNTGIFSTAIVRQVSSLQSGNENFTLQNFLELLKGLFIIAELDHGSYFMPCVLPLENLSSELRETQDCMKYNGIDGPFMISFKSKMSPRGLFCALLVALLQNPQWKLSTLQDDQIFRCRNLVEFDVSGRYSGKVTIIDRISRLEIYTTCEKNACLKIRGTVCKGFYEACCKLHYDSQDRNFGFPCTKCDREELHSTEVFQGDANEWKERCSVNQRKRPVPLMKERLVWFNNDSSLSSDVDTTSFLKQLCNDVASETNKWKLIALNLEISMNDVERIEQENRGDVQESFMRVFDKWQKENKCPFNWSTMVTVLRSAAVCENSLADSLNRRYCK